MYLISLRVIERALANPTCYVHLFLLLHAKVLQLSSATLLPLSANKLRESSSNSAWLSFWAKLPHSLRTLLLLHYYCYVRHTNSTPAQKAAALSNKMLSSEHPSSQQLSQQQQLPTLRQQHLVARSQLLATAAASSSSAG